MLLFWRKTSSLTLFWKWCHFRPLHNLEVRFQSVSLLVLDQHTYICTRTPFTASACPTDGIMLPVRRTGDEQVSLTFPLSVSGYGSKKRTSELVFRVQRICLTLSAAAEGRNLKRTHKLPHDKHLKLEEGKPAASWTGTCLEFSEPDEFTAAHQNRM